MLGGIVPGAEWVLIVTGGTVTLQCGFLSFPCERTMPGMAASSYRGRPELSTSALTSVQVPCVPYRCPLTPPVTGSSGGVWGITDAQDRVGVSPLKEPHQGEVLKCIR